MEMAYVFWITVIIAAIFGGLQFARNRSARKRETGQRH